VRRSIVGLRSVAALVLMLTLGSLAASSLALADGSTFVASSPAFAVPQFSDINTQHDPVWVITRSISIEGVITPRTPVPEPATLSLFGVGSLLAWRAKRRT
jgi:hypothetical protein